MCPATPTIPADPPTNYYYNCWIDTIGERPAVKKGMAVMADTPATPLTEEEKSILYGSKQFEKR
jgi:hypothetical protein